MSETNSSARPSASGHRFGPELRCSECGVTWDAHQSEPVPCRTADEAEAFVATHGESNAASVDDGEAVAARRSSER